MKILKLQTTQSSKYFRDLKQQAVRHQTVLWQFLTSNSVKELHIINSCYKLLTSQKDEGGRGREEN